MTNTTAVCHNCRYFCWISGNSHSNYGGFTAARADASKPFTLDNCARAYEPGAHRQYAASCPDSNMPSEEPSHHHTFFWPGCAPPPSYSLGYLLWAEHHFTHFDHYNQNHYPYEPCRHFTYSPELARAVAGEGDPRLLVWTQEHAPLTPR